MAAKPFDRALLRQLALAYAHAAVDDLLNTIPEPANNSKALRGGRAKKKARNKKP